MTKILKDLEKIRKDKKDLNSDCSFLNRKKMEEKEVEVKGEVKEIKINGNKVIARLPEGMNPKEFPKEFKSKPNHAEGLLVEK